MSDSESNDIQQQKPNEKQVEKKGKNGQVGRTDKQREATAKALAKLKEKREKLNELATKDAQEERKKKAQETEERLLGKLMEKLGIPKEEPIETKEEPKASRPKKQIIIEESESEPEVVIVKKKKPAKKKIIVQEESEEETAPKVSANAKAKAKPKKEEQPVEVQHIARTTGNKLLDKLYGYS